MIMIKHLNIKVFGQVQGVLFRQSARAKAREFGLSGLALNGEDGSVYLEAEGEAEKLKIFLDWCKRGPAFARVKKVEAEMSANLKNYTDFDIY